VVTVESEGHIRTSLKELLPSLDSEQFWQVYRGVIVRESAINSVDKDEEGKLRLSVRGHQEDLPVSSAFSHRFRGM
jgi:DNA-binding LytR/AlgR family response regulator